jgi:hypothetical protein
VQILAVFGKNVYRLLIGLIERKKNGVRLHPENVGLFCAEAEQACPGTKVYLLKSLALM